MHNPFKQNTRLPCTMDEFNELVKYVVDRYKLPDLKHAEANIISAIKRLPVDAGSCSYDYLGNSVIKHLAYTIADHRGKQLGYEAHCIDMTKYEEMLKTNPNDQEAIDGLERGAGAGSQFAKDILTRFREIDKSSHLHVIPKTNECSVVDLKT